MVSAIVQRPRHIRDEAAVATIVTAAVAAMAKNGLTTATTTAAETLVAIWPLSYTLSLAAERTHQWRPLLLRVYPPREIDGRKSFR